MRHSQAIQAWQRRCFSRFLAKSYPDSIISRQPITNHLIYHACYPSTGLTRSRVETLTTIVATETIILSIATFAYHHCLSPSLSAMPHPGNPAYFKEADPSAWDVKDYAKSQLADGVAPRRVQDAWHLSLKEIRQCNKGCCSQDEIDQANVHYGRWSHGAKTDRKYLAQWLKAKEAKAGVKKYRGGHSSFNIGSVGSIFNAPVDNAYNSTGDVLGSGVHTVTANDMQEAAVTTAPATKDDSDFQQLLSNFKTTYEQMTYKTLLSSGNYLETEIYNGVMEQVAGGFKEANQVFLWVIDLNDPIIKFSDEVLQEIRDRLLPLPKVHHPVIKSISGFVRCTTAVEFRNHAESTSYREDKPYNKEEHFDASWVHKAMLHLVTLIDDSGDLLQSDELLEGTLECVLWATLVDLLLLNVPLVVRRRDASLLAFRSRSNKSHGSSSPHFDAVISTRSRPRPSANNNNLIPDEWGIIEVSRKNDGPNSAKWKRDNLKILRGLCAMMRSARDYIGHDEATLKELQFVGLVLAGLDVMTVRLTCVGNLFVKQEGTLRSIPTTIDHLSEAFELLESLWLFKKMMVDCQKTVQSFIDTRARELKRPAPTSPGAYCREKMHKSGAL